MPFYTAFNLNFQSDFDLPELSPGDPSLPDVIIRQGNLGKTPRKEGPITCIRADQNEVLLAWGQVGLALIRNGHEVVIDPAPGALEEAIRLLLTGAVLGVLLHQRGLTVLHASAVAIDHQVVAFIGDKGAGKSSTAAALYARGHTLVTDDLLPIRFDSAGQAWVLPGFPQLKLWPDTAQVLGMDPDCLPRIRPDVDKLALRSHGPEIQPEYPLKYIYALARGKSPEIFPLEQKMIFFLLMKNIYVTRFGKWFHQPGMTPQPFEQCASLIKKVPVLGLQRKNKLSELPAIAHLVEQSIYHPSNDQQT